MKKFWVWFVGLFASDEEYVGLWWNEMIDCIKK